MLFRTRLHPCYSGHALVLWLAAVWAGLAYTTGDAETLRVAVVCFSQSLVASVCGWKSGGGWGWSEWSFGTRGGVVVIVVIFKGFEVPLAGLYVIEEIHQVGQSKGRAVVGESLWNRNCETPLKVLIAIKILMAHCWNYVQYKLNSLFSWVRICLEVMLGGDWVWISINLHENSNYHTWVFKLATGQILEWEHPFLRWCRGCQCSWWSHLTWCWVELQNSFNTCSPQHIVLDLEVC